MTYMNESDSSSSYRFVEYTVGPSFDDQRLYASGTYPYRVRSRSQFGWRTNRVAGPPADVGVIRDGSLAESLGMVESLDRLSGLTRGGVYPRRSRASHDRTYSETDSIHLPVPLAWKQNGGSIDERYRKVTLIVTNPVSAPSVSLPALADEQAIAAKMLRRMRPTRPHAEVARFVGELREFPRFFSGANYLPTSSREAGGAYLNVQFGMAPFIGDMQRMADSIVRSKPILDDFVERSSKLTYVAPSEKTDSFVPGTLMASSAQGFLVPGSVGQMYGEVVGSTTIRSFGGYEYFVGDPDDFLSRFQGYHQKAKHLLGTDLSADVLWQLTPWTWLTDWAVDISGLLAYQESVASDSLVLRDSGSSSYSTSTRSATLRLSQTTFNSLRGQSRLVATATSKRHRRTSGLDPYSLGLGGSMNPRRWAILGALGLTRAPGILA